MSIDYSKIMFPKSLKTNYTGCTKDISKTNRDKIKKLFNGECGLCGQTGAHIHHIIYKSEDRKKINDFNNLFLLCLNCHLKVHNNKKYWQPKLIELREKIGEEENNE